LGTSGPSRNLDEAEGPIVTRGRFITFEGGEGTGKSTQAAMLADRLRTFGLGVVVTREPGGSPGAEAIRHVVLSGAAQPFGSHAEAILFAAARDDHVRHLIRPALEGGRWVVCDRFADSTRIYQGTLGNVDPRVIRSLERISVGETRPDLTLILDVPPEMGLARAAERRGATRADRFEAEAVDFHNRLREAYRELAEQEPDRCTLIDASGEPRTVADAIWGAVSRRLDPSSAPLIIEGAR
jgi:dTMP kinase